MTALSAFRRDEAGFTLVELLVASALFSMIFITIGGLFITLIRTQETVRDSSLSANNSQLAATSIEVGVRNSSNFRLSTVSSGQLLVARTAGTGSALTWRCQAWYYSPAEGSIRTTSSSAAIGAPSPSALATWAVLVDDVQPRGGSTLFIQSGTELVVAFDALVETAQPVRIEFTVIPPVNDPMETSCF